MSTKVNEKVIAQADIEALEQAYTFRDREAVLEYLLDYYFLMPPLLEAPVQITKYFPGKRLSLALADDPEIPNYVQLIVGIEAIGYEPEELIEKLDQFQRDWGHKVIDRIGRRNWWRLMFTWDFLE